MKARLIQIGQYKNILTFTFAIDEINKNPELLPNVTLGYHIFDTCGSPRKSLKTAIQIMSGKGKEAPNYSCKDHGKLAAFVLDPGLHTNSALIQFLSLYRFTQITYGTSDPLLSDRISYPTVYQVSPDDWVRYEAIVKCLLYFGWTWVGIITQENGIGEMESEVLSKMMIQHKICVDFTITISRRRYKSNRIELAKISQSRVKVIVLCGPYTIDYFTSIREAQLENITFIVHDTWTRVPEIEDDFITFFNCSLTFLIPLKKIPKFDLLNVNPANRPNDLLLEYIWLLKLHNMPGLPKCTARNCSCDIFFSIWSTGLGVEDCRSTPNFLAPAPARYHMTYRYIIGSLMEKSDPSKLLAGIRGREESDYDVLVTSSCSRDELRDWPRDPHRDLLLMSSPSVGKEETAQLLLRLNPGIPGDTRAVSSIPTDREGITNLMRQVHKCSIEPRISQDSKSCSKCPADEWPDKKNVTCIPKSYEFLSYEKDIISLIFLGIVLFLSAITLFVLGLFIYHWDTPIVKANNRTVSVILLVSILLGFLSVVFFLGRPVDITCLLRQISFGIFFSIGVSSVLAKTITVCIAFKASKPGSIWRKWISVNVSYYVVFICSSVQVLICIIWLLVSPPYVDFDHHSYPGKILIQCNEGSDIWFYSMLGYMGFLAAVSFVLAFLVRTLPDSFNEAKYITFSMLVFCSVWIAMIPAYLSTRGKYMVAVEIFAILTSCAAYMIPIFKKRSKSDPGNYRLVSLTSIVGKVFEGFVRDAKLEYLDENNLITQHQHGFMRDRSCQTNLIGFYEETSSEMACGEVNRDLLENRLKTAGFKRETWKEFGIRIVGVDKVCR
ncbi:vomeronasal type-2 receptor 26-like [Dendropsophus ebraccatus]|uniref:vomeronasal type-2 receptor 26-like n=1 Tax=Dendropsophus ebraccatus TaxID=150705 RepID=UPI0038312D12